MVRDGAQVGIHAGATLECVRIAEHAIEGFLGDFLGHVRVAGKGEGKAIDLPEILGVELLKIHGLPSFLISWTREKRIRYRKNRKNCNNEEYNKELGL